MMTHSYGALFWDPGTRKTSTGLYAFKLLRDAGFVKRMLVLSTVNIINDVWGDEIEKWDSLDITYANTHGMTQKRRRAQFDLDSDIFLVNNDNVEWLWSDVWKKGLLDDVDMLYVDEGGEYRNSATHRFRALRKMLPSFKRRYVAGGSPMPKTYLNLWSQFFIIDRGESLGATLTDYKLRYFEPGGFKGKEWLLREGADVEIQRAIAPRVSRVEKHLDVTMSIEDRWVELPGKALKAYGEIEEEFITEWQGEMLTAANAAVATTKLRQAANGAVYRNQEPGTLRADRGWVEIHKAKIDELKKLMKELDGPLIVAYEYGHDLAMMRKHGLKMPSYSEAKAGKERTEIKDAWNRGEFRVLATQIDAASHGLNIQHGGHYLAYYGLTFDLEAYEQFYQRLWRDGQQHDVTAFRIVARGTVDEVMMDVLRVRDADQRALLKALRGRYGL